MKLKNFKYTKIILAVLIVLISMAVGIAIGYQNRPHVSVANDESCKIDEAVFCQTKAADIKKLKSSKKYKSKNITPLIGKKIANTGQSYTYSVEVRGNVRTSLSSFAAAVAGTLTSPKGWAQIGNFSQGNNKNFIILLTPAGSLPSFSSACSSSWSCRVGPYVIINESRWLSATSSWNSAGGSLRDYQHMVINHEVGHWLGKGHVGCGGSGELAPIMQQQSISLQGCRHNPWPLPSEL